jgi:hypothetical protein
MRDFVVRWATASRRALGAGAMALLMVLAGGARQVAVAQAARTWVSAVGDDANPCSRTGPCRTWTGAIAKTAVAGEIDVLDPGDFGAANITKPLTLDGAGVLAITRRVVVTLTSGRPDDVVVLRNMSIQSDGTPGSGITINSNTAVQVEDSSISGFDTHGIDFEPTQGAPALFVSNCEIHDNGNAGIYTFAQNGSAALLTVDGAELSNNAFGLNTRGTSFVIIRNSVLSGNTSVGLQVQGVVGSGLTTVGAIHVQASLNATGVLVQGGGNLRMTDVSVFDNAVGLTNPDHSPISAIGANHIDGNGSGNQPSIVAFPEQ